MRLLQPLQFFLLLVVGCLDFSFAQTPEIDSLTQQLINAKNDSSRVDHLNERAFLLIYDHPGHATKDAMEALDLAESIAYNMGIARSHNILGGIHWALGEYDRAIEYYYIALKDYEALHDSVGITKCFNNLAEVNKKLKNYDESLLFLKKAQRLAESFATPLIIYINLGDLFTLLEQYDSAEFYFNKAMANPAIYESKRHMGMVYTGMAKSEYRRGNFNDALIKASNALENNKASANKRGIANSQFLLGNIHYALRNSHNSAQYFDSALVMAESIKGRDLQMQIYKRYSEIFAGHGDFENALKEYENYVSVKDSSINEVKAAQIAHLATEYETDFLIQQKESAEKGVRKRNIAIIGIIMLLILSLALICGLIRQRITEKRINQLLEAKNAQIQEKNEKILNQSDQLRSLNERLTQLNSGLEKRVKSSLELLERRNKTLEEYAYANAHELRAPIASILGLLNLLKTTRLNTAEDEIVQRLFHATTDLDNLLRTLREKLEFDS